MFFLIHMFMSILMMMQTMFMMMVMMMIMWFLEIEEGTLHHLGEGRMDVHAIYHGIGFPIVGVHEIDDLLDKDGCMRSDDMGSQYLVGICIHDHLDKVILCTHCLALGSVLV